MKMIEYVSCLFFLAYLKLLCRWANMKCQQNKRANQRTTCLPEDLVPKVYILDQAS